MLQYQLTLRKEFNMITFGWLAMMTLIGFSVGFFTPYVLLSTFTGFIFGAIIRIADSESWDSFSEIIHGIKNTSSQINGS